jgi:DDE superfamily endonuclease
MGLLRPVAPDWRVLLQEIDEFRTFLAGNPRAERGQFLPFFYARDQLCACPATFNNAVLEPDHVAHEFALWGDFVCDTLSGSKRNGAFVLIEFEDASATSLFRRVAGRRVSRWGARVEAGTDHYRAYDAALRELGLSSIHRRGMRLNNRAESSNVPIRRRKRNMQGFRSAGSDRQTQAACIQGCWADLDR